MNDQLLDQNHVRAMQLFRERTAHQKNIQSINARIETIELELAELDKYRNEIMKGKSE